jgi:tetratricopeptide (TPR) repeat protein
VVLDLPPNAFHQTMLHLAYGTADADLFSRACIEQYDERPSEAYGYLFAQVFEPFVLNEIALLEGCNRSALEQLEVGSGSRMDRLRADMGASSVVKPVQAVNIAAALISISRFKLAEILLSSIQRAKCSARDLFEIAMLEFVIANRLANTDGMRQAFLRMRDVIETADIPVDRIMDAATQAVVWHMKSAQVDEATFNWFFALGKSLLADDTKVKAGSKSSWYRAIAMIPAALGDKVATRELMHRARTEAEEAVDTPGRAYEMHFLKTYHESSLKEYMYVARDKDAALAEAEALIAIDPHWSPSYGERAEVYERFGDWQSAAMSFERAGRLGPPYVGHHLFSAALAWERTDAPETALPIYQDLLQFDETNPSVVVAGVRLARRLGDTSGGAFSKALTAIDGRLTPEHRKYLQD